VTRACIDKIGLMKDSYWLHGEDFDWGFAPRRRAASGYAHNSVARLSGEARRAPSASAPSVRLRGEKGRPEVAAKEASV